MTRLVLVALLTLTPLARAEQPALPRPAGGPDVVKYSGLSPERAAAAMTVPEDFRVTLFAGEPDVHQPIAFCIDDRGRLWVVEALVYPRRLPFNGPLLPEAERKQGDRILIFEDTDGDGKFDKKTTFIEGLNLVSGIEVGFGGVWVGAAPYLMFIPNIDDKPGEIKVLLDGWHFEDTHETLNTFCWGPDGWLYGCHGVFTHSRVGKPGTPDRDRVPINAGIWRYHPTRHVFEVFAEGTSNPWGLDYNERGEFFVEACVIPHCFHMIQGGRYLRQAGSHFNPYTYADIGTIADHLHYVGPNPHGGNNRSDSAGGGHAHCGLMCYLGGAWPDKYKGQLFMGNIHGKRINMDVLKPKGSGYVASHGPDFLLANDEWARFINLKYGPDGNVYLIDWYDKQACHHNDPGVWDRTNGRVYKINYRGTKPVAGIDLQRCTDEELVAYQSNANEWYVRHARRILQERVANDPQRAATITTHLNAAPRPATAGGQLHLLWALHAVGALGGAECARWLEDATAHAYARAWAVQLALESAPADPALLSALFQAAQADSSLVVRRYIASGLQRLQSGQRPAVAAGLFAHADDATDFNLPLLYWYALEPLAGADPKAALDFAAAGRVPILLEFVARRIATTSSLKQNEILFAALSKAAAARDAGAALVLLRGMSEGFRGRRGVAAPTSWSSTAEQLAKLDNADVRSLALSLATHFGNTRAIEALRTVLADPQADTAARHNALATLVAARDKDLPTILYRLLAESAFRAAALRGLAAFDDPRTPAAVLGVWVSLTTAERRDALNTLAARPAYARALLTAVADRKLMPSDVPADVIRAMRNLADKDVAAQLKQFWGTIRETPADRAKAIADLRKQLAASPPGDLSLGRAVFAKSCQQCHMLYGVGAKVGPDITGSNRSDLNYLLENVLDPSAVIPKDYMATVLNLTNGRTVTGIIKVDAANSFTVQTANEMLDINKDDIEALRHSRVSMMPDDLLKPLGDAEVRGLFAYLRHPQQVPMLATAENAKDFFNGKDLTGWAGDPNVWSVRDGELIRKVAGAKAELLTSDLTADDFRLSMKVKWTSPLAGDIVFRGEIPPGGEVKGLCAGVGPGAWGRLTETNGRVLSKPGIEPDNPAGWNAYTIEVRDGHVRLTVNGRINTEYGPDDRIPRRGVIALRLPAVDSTEVRFKELKLEVLPAPGK